MADEKEQSKMCRRRIMCNSGYVAGGAIAGGILG